MPREPRAPRDFGYRPSRLALIAAVAIVGASVAAYLLARACSAPHATKAPIEEAAPVPSSAPDDRATPPSDETPARPVTIVEATPAAPPTASPAGPRGAAGMIVGIDPVTGQLGLPNEEARAALSRGALASPALDRSAQGLTVVHKPDGSKMIDLQGRFQDYMVVRIGPDGQKTESCVQGPEVEAALKGGDTPTTPTSAPPAPPTPPASADR